MHALRRSRAAQDDFRAHFKTGCPCTALPNKDAFGDGQEQSAVQPFVVAVSDAGILLYCADVGGAVTAASTQLYGDDLDAADAEASDHRHTTLRAGRKNQQRGKCFRKAPSLTR
jgi:hypothetical protein